jgi:hypothetical protein
MAKALPTGFPLTDYAAGLPVASRL